MTVVCQSKLWESRVKKSEKEKDEERVSSVWVYLLRRREREDDFTQWEDGGIELFLHENIHDYAEI